MKRQPPKKTKTNNHTWINMIYDNVDKLSKKVTKYFLELKVSFKK